jgi:hypothetical protein
MFPAWGAGELCSPRTIAGGFGNPLGVPISMRGVEPLDKAGEAGFVKGLQMG